MLKFVKYAVLPLIVAAAVPAFAQKEDRNGWQVELKKLALNATSTEVRYAKEYQGFPDARLTADSQTSLTGTFHGLADYYSQNWLWSNTLLMDYGRTRIRPVDGENLTNENADRILFTTGYTQRLWHANDFLGGFEAGPFANIGYETEFTKLANSPRRKIYRGMLGAKIFDGNYLKALYAAVVGESDQTYNPSSEKLAWEAGLRLEAPMREGVKAQFSALFRDYLHESRRQATDLDYEFELDARVEVQMFKEVYIAPFVNYYTAQGKYMGPRGENVYVGVALSFSHIFKQAKVKSLVSKADLDKPAVK